MWVCWQGSTAACMCYQQLAYRDYHRLANMHCKLSDGCLKEVTFLLRCKAGART